MSKKPATAEEKRHMARVSESGCVICNSAPCEIHHPRFAGSMGKRSPHYLSVGLCAEHHRLGGHGVAIHAGQQTFESMYGSEAELLAETIRRVFIGNN